MATVEVSLKDIMTSVEGALGAAVVDYSSGMALGTLGGGRTWISPSRRPATPT